MICNVCGQEHNGTYGSGRFCSEACARKFSRMQVKDRTKTVKCKCCGNVYEVNLHCSCNYICDKCKNVCKISGKTSCDECLIKKHGFCEGNKNSISQKISKIHKIFTLEHIGKDDKLINELLIIQNRLIQDLKEGLSNNDICIKYTGSSKKGNTLLKNLNIKGRSLKESVINAALQGKTISQGVNQYKSCWHTTWDGKEVFLRSSYELDYALQLDSSKVLYEVEHLRIKYFNTKYNEYRCAVPDFYLPESNTIVEIKSTYTLDIQNMRDKFKAYSDLGYNTVLILDKHECKNLL
jgi:hypothetical protein